MRLGCNTIHPTSRLGDETTEFRAPTILQSLHLIAAAGFTAVEFSHMSHLRPGECETIRQAVAELDLEAWSAHAWQPLPGAPDDIENALEALTPSVVNAERLGCKVLVVHAAGFAPNDPDGGASARREASLFVLRHLCEAAAEFDAKVAVENMQYLRDWEFVVDLVRSSGMPNAGLNLDTGHANLGDLGVEQAIRMGGELLCTTHLQDNHGKIDEHLPPGEGDIDWIAALSLLKEVGYAGVLMVEITDRPAREVPTPATDILTAYDNLTRFLTRIGW